MNISQKIKSMIALRILLLIGTGLLCAGCAYIIRDRLDTFYTVGTIILSVVILVYVAFKSGLVAFLRDRNWIGKVVKVSQVQDREPIRFMDAASRRMPALINYTVIDVQTDDSEKPIQVKVPSSKIAPSVFAVGDTIKHYRGMKYPQNPDRSVDVYICPVCGYTRDDNYCPVCHLKF